MRSYRIIFATRSVRPPGIMGRVGQEGPFEQNFEAMADMLEAFKAMARNPEVTMLAVMGADGQISDRDLYQLTGLTGR